MKTKTITFEVRQGHIDLAGYASHEAGDHAIDVDTYLDEDGIVRYGFAHVGLIDVMGTLGVKKLSFSDSFVSIPYSSNGRTTDSESVNRDSNS